MKLILSGQGKATVKRGKYVQGWPFRHKYSYKLHHPVAANENEPYRRRENGMLKRTHPITNIIVNTLRDLGLVHIDCDNDTLTAATAAGFGFIDDSRTSGVVLGLDLEQHYADAKQEIQVPELRSHEQGLGCKIMDAVMECVPESVSVIAADATDDDHAVFGQA